METGPTARRRHRQVRRHCSPAAPGLLQLQRRPAPAGTFPFRAQRKSEWSPFQPDPTEDGGCRATRQTPARKRETRIPILINRRYVHGGDRSSGRAGAQIRHQQAVRGRPPNRGLHRNRRPEPGGPIAYACATGPTGVPTRRHLFELSRTAKGKTRGEEYWDSTTSAAISDVYRGVSDRQLRGISFQADVGVGVGIITEKAGAASAAAGGAG